LRLLFDAPGEQDLPGNAIAHIYLNKWIRGNIGGRDTTLLTPERVSFREFQHYIKTLHEELEEIERQAKRKFTEFDERIELRRSKG
jgi:hypothetical protein